MSETVSPINSVDPVQASSASDNTPDLAKLAHLLLVRKLSALENKVGEHTQIISERSKLIDFLSRYHQILNSPDAVDPKTQKLDLSKIENIDDFFADAAALMQQAQALRDEAATLPPSKKRDQLEQAANEMEDTVNATSLLLGKKQFSKEERVQLIDNVRLQQDLLKAQQSYSAHEVQRHTGERNEMIPLIRDIMNKLYEAVKKALSAAAGR